MKDIVTTDFMKGVVDDLGLDVGGDEMEALMKEAGLGNEEEKKEEEPNKPPDDKDKKKDEEKDEKKKD